MPMHNKLSALLGELEIPVRTIASDEGILFERTEQGLRIRKQLRAGNGGSMSAEGSGQTDRHNYYLPRRQ